MVITGGDAGFQVDDLQIGTVAVENLQSISPYVCIVNIFGDLSARFFGNPYILFRVFHIRFMQLRITRMGKHLVDAPASHHITAYEKGELSVFFGLDHRYFTRHNGYR